MIYISTRYYGYTFANGVDSSYYNDPFKWDNQIPTTSWVNNTNILEGSSSLVWIWLISPVSNSYGVFSIDSGGIGTYSNPIGYYGIRPTLYLSSSVNIIDGDGSSSNPYWLSL